MVDIFNVKRFADFRVKAASLKIFFIPDFIIVLFITNFYVSSKKVVQRKTSLNLTSQSYLQPCKITFIVATEDLWSVSYWKLIDKGIRFMHIWVILFLSFCTNFARTLKFVSSFGELCCSSIVLVRFSVFNYFFYCCYFIRMQLMLAYVENHSSNKDLASMKEIHEVITLH